MHLWLKAKTDTMLSASTTAVIASTIFLTLALALSIGLGTGLDAVAVPTPTATTSVTVPPSTSGKGSFFFGNISSDLDSDPAVYNENH